MIFADTGGWFALFVPWDTNHVAAQTWHSGNSEPLLTTDFVLDEVLTLLKARREYARALSLGTLLFGGDLAQMHRVTDGQFRRAWDVFRTFTDKDWSFTDCTSKVVMEDLGIITAFSFDQHFRQFGTITVVP